MHRSKISLFDHLVGAGEQRGRNFKAKRAGGGQIDDQLKLARLHYRQVGRLSTLEDFAGVDADLTVRFGLARSVAHEAASFRILAYIVDGWNRMSCRQCGKLETPASKERIRPYAFFAVKRMSSCQRRLANIDQRDQYPRNGVL